MCDEKTGQCNCKPKIGGLNCNICSTGYYNLTSYGCVNKCNCDPAGSLNKTFCNPNDGKCVCKTGYTGRNCSLCANGYWRSNSECKKCECNLNGILNPNNICDQVNINIYLYLIFE